MPVSDRVIDTRSLKPAASYTRFSTDLQDARSLRDQQRKCHDRAARDGCEIIHEFTDEALSGAKNDRPGYLALLAHCRAGGIEVLYVESLSRLSRDALESQKTLLDLAYNFGVRVVAIDDGIDTAQENWELIAGIHGHQNQQFLRTLGKQIKRGQDGIALEGLCLGDTRFGYRSEPVEEPSRRRGRDVKPKRRYAIDSEQAKWVVRIFAWFTRDRWSLTKISQELNQQKVLRDPKAASDKWTPAAVRAILECPKYVGLWDWGRQQVVRNPITGKKRRVTRPETSPEVVRREIPELAIVDRAMFEVAGRRIEENRRFGNARRDEKGRLLGSRRSPKLARARYLFSSLIECAACRRRMIVVGAEARYFKCANSREGNCECSSHLPRKLAEQQVLEQLSTRLFENEHAVELLLDEVQGLVRLAEREGDTTARLEQEIGQLQKKIASLLDLYETNSDPEIAARLAERTREKKDLVSRMEASRRAAQSAPPIVTREWVQEQLKQLAEVLDGEAEAASPLLASLLVGGKIVATEVPVPGMKRKYFRLSFAFDLQASASRMLGTERPNLASEPAEWIELDVRLPYKYKQVADQVVALREQGLPYREVAERIGISAEVVSHAYAHWHKARGLEVPCQRAVRCTKAPSDEVLAMRQKVIEKFDDGLLYSEIAAALDCKVWTVQKHIEDWHSERGLPKPNGHDRCRAITEARRLLSQKGIPSESDEKPRLPSPVDPPEFGDGSQPIVASCVPRNRAG